MFHRHRELEKYRLQEELPELHLHQGLEKYQRHKGLNGFHLHHKLTEYRLLQGLLKLHLHPKLIAYLVHLKLRESQLQLEPNECHLHQKPAEFRLQKGLQELHLHPRLVAFQARKELLQYTEFHPQADQAEYQVCLYLIKNARLMAMAFSVMVLEAMVHLSMDHQPMLTRHILLILRDMLIQAMALRVS